MVAESDGASDEVGDYSAARAAYRATGGSINLLEEAEGVIGDIRGVAPKFY
jgi:hypothetical protein